MIANFVYFVKSMPDNRHSPHYPMRVNRYLAQKGIATRRDADILIEKKKVFINGRLAVLGDKVIEDDVVEVRSKGTPKKYRYFAYNKPTGIITHSPQFGEEDIEKETRKFPELRGTFPVGRLDKDSHGLIILTNDGRVTDRMLNPSYEHEKEYLVRVRKPLRDSFQKNMESGVDIEGYRTKTAIVKRLGDLSFRITLTEGKKHQIGGMVAALHNEVADLKRVRIMSITLGDLSPGSYRSIEKEELSLFLKTLGLQ